MNLHGGSVIGREGAAWTKHTECCCIIGLTLFFILHKLIYVMQETNGPEVEHTVTSHGKNNYKLVVNLI